MHMVDCLVKFRSTSAFNKTKVDKFFIFILGKRGLSLQQNDVSGAIIGLRNDSVIQV